MLPLLLHQDGKKGGKKERFCHKIWRASTARPGAPGREYAVLDFAPEGEDMAALGGMHQNRRTSHDLLTFDF